MKLTDHVVFITGASSGIGEACAHQAAELGATVIISARRLARLEEIAAELKQKYNATVYCCQLDVSQKESITTALNNLVPEVRNNISILINNAGLALGTDLIQDGDPQDWDSMIDTNVKGLLYVTRAILPGMITKDRGHVINIGSVAGKQVYPKGAIYCATKHAVHAISQGLRMDLQGTKIRVTEIEPGMVETEFSVVRNRGNQSAADTLYANMTPLTPTDVAESVMFAATRPAHVNVSEVLMMPTDQASVYHVHRRGEN